MTETLFGWVIIVLALLGAWISIATGRVRFNAVWYVHRTEKPRVFWLAVCAPLLVGIVIVVYGLH
jgi:hypothetical protein